MIPLVKPFLPPRDELLPALEETIYSGYIAEGEVVKDFEKVFGEYIGNPYALSLNSGTSALHIALILAGVKQGDEVISTALTAEPTNVAIMQAGANVVWADVDASTGLISAHSIREKITPLTKAIMVVHYAGMVCNLDEIHSVSRETGIPVIEDAAHALGALYQNKKIGNHSPFTIFSFQAIKHLTTIDGGMLMLDNKDNWDRGRLIRWFGLDKTKSRLENDISVLGYKYHMNNVNATIGLVQMRHVERVVSSYVNNGIFYDEHLKDIPGVKLLPYYIGAKASYWLYTMKVERRDDFCKYMFENGVMASELHQRNDRHSIFNYRNASLPALDEFYKSFVHIPCGWWIGEEERNHIIELIKKGW